MTKTKEKLASNCDECPVWSFIPANDAPAKTAGLWWRCIFSFISVATLGQFIKPDAQSGLFVSYLLYSVPLIREYFGYYPKDTSRKCINVLGRTVCATIGSVSFLGLIEIFSVGYKNGAYCILINKDYVVLSGSGIPYRWLWYLGLVSVFLTFVDVFAYKPGNSRELIASASTINVT